MANEATVRCSILVNKTNLQYVSRPGFYQATITGSLGPAPGAFTAGTDGTNVDLSQFTQPGLCEIKNLDSTNYVEFGIHDGTLFYPLGQLLPGEAAVLRLSQNLGVKEDMPGTGTTGKVTSLCVRANTAPCPVFVGIFEN